MAHDGFARAITPSTRPATATRCSRSPPAAGTAKSTPTHRRRAGGRGDGRSDRARGDAGRELERRAVGARAGHRARQVQVNRPRRIDRAHVRAAVARRPAPRCWRRRSSARRARSRRCRTASRPATCRGTQATVWSRADRPARMVVEYATTETLPRSAARRRSGRARSHRLHGARRRCTDLPPGQRIFYRVLFQDLADLPGVERSGRRQLHDAACRPRRRDVTIAWSADTVGQGWGINPEWGGLRLYETMRRAQPDLFIHCGDTIYADGPLARRGQARRRHACGATS